MTETTAEERRKTRACCTRHRPRANGDCADCWCLEATAQQRRRKQAEAQRDDAREVLERVRPILCGLAIEVEQKQKAEGSHYLTDAVAVKDAVVAYLSGLSTDTSPCERVSDQQYLDGVRIKPHCATHGCDWPDGEKECPA